MEHYDPFADGDANYLSNMDLSIGFASTRKVTDRQYDQDELAKYVTGIFENQILSPGQQFMMDHKGIPLRLEVKTTQLGDLSMAQTGKDAPPRPNQRGILTRHTTINFFRDAKGTPVNLAASNRRPAANAIIQPDFKFEDMGIGGLDTEFSVIFRRAFASRIFPPGIIEKLGIQHVKGILLYGPPGTGKTLIARQIGKMLNAREPKIINGPEVLNKYVGQSEENIRKLFADAEKEYKEKGDESALHIIIFDELDAVCKQRGSGGQGGTGVGDSVVNQLLSKLDGVDQLNNILLIGMTNRMDMIDDALLRPGRLELKVEISLPDEAGRVQILNIHTTKMRNNSLLSSDVNIEELAALTKNFSGAEIAGLVKAATSFAFNRHTKAGTMAGIKDDVVNMKITRADFMNALTEVQPAFGVSEAEIGTLIAGGIYHFSPNIDRILRQGELDVDVVRNTDTSRLSVLVHGPPGSGKTALAAKIALDSGFPFIRLISPQTLSGYNDAGKVQQINKVFSDAYKSSMSVILIDEIENLIDWSSIGPRFSITLVGALRTAITTLPEHGRKIMVIATTSEYTTLQHLNLVRIFNSRYSVPYVNGVQELGSLLEQANALGNANERAAAVNRFREIKFHAGVKDVLFMATKARRSEDPVGTFTDLMEENTRTAQGLVVDA